MKNFTNNFKQFTSRLSARWLIMALMMLVGTSSAWGKVLYLKPNSDWESSSAKFSVWAWADGGAGKWFAASKGSSGYYEVTVDDNRVNFLWARYSSSISGTNFGTVWNQVGDFKTSNGNLVTITGWSSGTLSTYTPVTITGYALGGFDDWSNLIQMIKDGNVYTCTKDLSKTTYTTNTDAGFKIIEQYSDASAKWFGNNGTMTRSESSGWTMEENKNNCGITADVAGTYTFTFDASTKKLTVTYPTPTYNITYKDKGNVTFSGTHETGYPKTHTYGTATTLKTASKTGYTFGGWFTNSNCTGNAVTSLGATAYSADITLYAKWTAKTYTITYDANGGSGAPSNQTKTYGVSLTLTTSKPTRDGYNFTGWNTAANGSGTAYASGAPYTANAAATLYAQWQVACSLPNSVSITGETTPCAESTQTYTANITGGADYDLVWTFPEGCTKTNETNNSITLTIGNASGNIICTAKCSESSTKASDPLAITVKTAPAVPTLSADKTSLVSPDKATLTAGNTTNGLTYTLYNGETPGESQESTGGTLNFKVGEAGNYTVRVSNSCGTSTSSVVTITVCTPQTNEFRHANSSYVQQQAQPTYYPGDKAYFVSTGNCCLTGTWSNNLQKGEEGWWTGLTGSTPRFSMTLTRAGEFTITNMATNGCTQDKNVKVNLDFTITALSEVTNSNGTASGANIVLTWNHSANHSNVMVVRYPINETETIPAGGQAYTAGNTLGGGTVVYVGTETSYTDQNLPAGANYKYYFYTVNNNYYSEGVVLNMSSCPVPAKPQLTSTPVTVCDDVVTADGYITIGNMSAYTDDDYTFNLGNETAYPDANGKITISSAEYTEYTVTVINSCGNSNSADVDIAINNITPTISGATIAQPGKANAIELTVPTGITAEWSVSPEADLSVSKGNSTMFSAEKNGRYTITATNGTCSDTHVVTVADAFYIYFRNAKEGETAYSNFYDPNQNTEEVRGGEMFYAECDALPTNGNNSLPTHFVNYNKGGRKADIITTDCDGYTWYGFKASAEVVAGAKYFYVHATNDINYNGHYTHTVPTQKALTSDVYYTLGTTNHATTHYGWNITLASAPYAGPKVHALGSTALDTDKFAALYVTDCSGKEITGYQWYKDGQPYSSVCSYVGKKGAEDSNAGETNNIRPTVAGNYSCTVTYEGGTTATSAAVPVTGTYSRSFTSNIPVLVVNTGGKGFPDCTGISGQTASRNASKFKEKRSVDVKIYDGEGALVYDRKARMNYRGSSSLNFVKKSYAFCPGDANCEEKDGQADYVKTAKLNMLGVGKACDKDWVLYAAAADPSLMRNRLVFDSYKAMTGKWGVNSRYVELIVDGVYKGVYVFMDKITMNTERVKVDKDKGFIVKFDKTDREDRVGGYNGILGDEKTFKTSRTGKDDIKTYDTYIDQRFEIEYPEKDDYTTGWKARVDGIQGMFQAFEDALNQGDYATVQKYIDYTSWADWFIINEFTKNVDAYRASCIFVYTGEAGAKIEARPLWDQELSFNNQASNGTSDKGSNSTTGLLIQHSNVYSDAFKAPFWFTGGSSDIKGGLLSDPCFVQVVKERWNMHQFDALSKKSLEDLVDEYEDELAPEGTTDNALKRETAFWNGKSRGKCDCSYDTGNATATGYQNKTFAESTGTITNWISDAAASNATGRRAGLTTAINGLTGASFSIQIIPSEAYTTPWEPVEIAVSVTPAGYDYKLEYTGDNNLGGVANTIIKEEGDKITYRIPRPSDWGVGDAEEGARADIEYGIKATLSVQEGTTVCGSQAAPSSTGKIILQDEDNDNCK